MFSSLLIKIKKFYVGVTILSLFFGQSGVFLGLPEKALAEDLNFADTNVPCANDIAEANAIDNEIARLQIEAQSGLQKLSPKRAAEVAMINQKIQEWKAKRQLIEFEVYQIYECGATRKPSAFSVGDVDGELARANDLIRIYDQRLEELKSTGIAPDFHASAAKAAREWMLRVKIPALKVKLELVRLALVSDRCVYIDKKVKDLELAVKEQEVLLEKNRYRREARQINDQLNVLKNERNAWINQQNKPCASKAPPLGPRPGASGLLGGPHGMFDNSGLGGLGVGPPQPPVAPQPVSVPGTTVIVSPPACSTEIPPARAFDQMKTMESQLKSFLQKVDSKVGQKAISNYIEGLKASSQFKYVFTTDQGSIYFVAGDNGPSWRFKNTAPSGQVPIWEVQPVLEKIAFIDASGKAVPFGKGVTPVEVGFVEGQGMGRHIGHPVGGVIKQPPPACVPGTTVIRPPVQPGGGLTVGPTQPQPPVRGFPPIKDMPTGGGSSAPAGGAPQGQPLGIKDLGSGMYRPPAPQSIASAQDYVVGCLGGGGASSRVGSFEALNFALENLDLVDGEAFAKVQSDQLRFGTVDAFELLAPDQVLLATDNEGKVNILNNEGTKVGSLSPGFSTEENAAFNLEAQKIVDSRNLQSIAEQDTAFREEKIKLQVKSGRAQEIVRAHNAKRVAYRDQGLKSKRVALGDLACPFSGTENLSCYQNFDFREHLDLYGGTPKSPLEALTKLDPAQVRLKAVSTNTGFGVTIVDNNGNSLGVLAIDSQVAAENIAKDFARRRFEARASIVPREGVSVANAATERICPPPKPPKPSSAAGEPVKTGESPKLPGGSKPVEIPKGTTIVEKASAPFPKTCSGDLKSKLANFKKMGGGAFLGVLGIVGLPVGIGALKNGLTGAKEAALEGFTTGKGLAGNAFGIAYFEFLSLAPGAATPAIALVAALAINDVRESWAADVQAKNREIAGQAVANALTKNPQNIDAVFNQFLIAQGPNASIAIGRPGTPDYVRLRMDSPEVKRAFLDKLTSGIIKVDELLDLGIPDSLKGAGGDFRDVIYAAREYRKAGAQAERRAYEVAQENAAQNLVMKDPDLAAELGVELDALLDSPEADAAIMDMIRSNDALFDTFNTLPLGSAAKNYNAIKAMKGTLRRKADILLNGRTPAQIAADCVKKQSVPSLIEQIGQFFAPTTQQSAVNAPQTPVYSAAVPKPNYVFTVSPGGEYNNCKVFVNGKLAASIPKKLIGDFRVPIALGSGFSLAGLKVNIACNEGTYSVNSFTFSPAVKYVPEMPIAPTADIKPLPGTPKAQIETQLPSPPTPPKTPTTPTPATTPTQSYTPPPSFFAPIAPDEGVIYTQ